MPRTSAAAASSPEGRVRLAPLALLPVLALLALPLIGSPSTWLTLTVAGLAMGMIIFIIASGLTLVFGLMDVLNFGHGVFIALGAFVATSVLGAHGATGPASASCWRNLVAVFAGDAGRDGGGRRGRLGLRARASCGRSTAST